LSAYNPIADEGTGELSEDTKTFVNLMFENERLRLELDGIFNAIGCPEGFDPMDWQGLANAGNVNPQLWTYLMGLTYSGVQGPLGQFQHTIAEIEDTNKLIAASECHVVICHIKCPRLNSIRGQTVWTIYN